MKKIYCIRNGNIIFYTVLFLGVTIALIGALLIPRVESIGLFCCSVLLFVASFILKTKNYLSYIVVDAKGVKTKDNFYLWEEVRITVDYSKPNQHGRNAYVYQFYFDTNFLENEIDRKECKNKGAFIDINNNRLNTILQYYNGNFMIINESPLQPDILQKIKEHNLEIG